jgi:GLPGLI family protein
MKKIILCSGLLLSFLNSFAQKDFQGMAVYETKTSTADFMKGFANNKEMTPDRQKMIEERMKTMFEKTFILNFDKSASIYKEEEKLEAQGQQGGGGMRMMASFMGGGGTLYKNVKDKSYTVDKEFMGKEFLIKDSLVNYKWKMEGETRQIGGYTCYKATAVRPASKSDFRNYKPKGEEVKKDETSKADASEKKTNFMPDFEVPKEITITAWYTPEIPISQGPEGYWGLPGLILEVNDGKTVMLCSKVVLNAKEKADIKAPKNGKVTSQAEYDEMIVKKTEEFRSMNQGKGDGRQMQIRMGH